MLQGTETAVKKSTSGMDNKIKNSKWKVTTIKKFPFNRNCQKVNVLSGDRCHLSHLRLKQTKPGKSISANINMHSSD